MQIFFLKRYHVVFKVHDFLIKVSEKHLRSKMITFEFTSSLDPVCIARVITSPADLQSHVFNSHSG